MKKLAWFLWNFITLRRGSKVLNPLNRDVLRVEIVSLDGCTVSWHGEDNGKPDVRDVGIFRAPLPLSVIRRAK